MLFTPEKHRNHIKSDTIRTPGLLQNFFKNILVVLYSFLVPHGFKDAKTYLKPDTIRNSGACWNCGVF